jgi:hypothetical protein
MKLLALPLVALLPLSAAAAADVHVVDGAGAGEFIEIADAVAAATDGDVVLVRAGTYALPVVIDGLAIDLMADVGAHVVLGPGLIARNTGIAQTVTISGLELRGGFLFDACRGSLQVQDVVVPQPPAAAQPAGLAFHFWGQCGIGESTQTVRQCDRVSFTGCTLHGAHGMTAGWDGTPGEHGLHVLHSQVALFDCVLTGGHGGDPLTGVHPPVYGGAGGDGLHVVGPSSSVVVDRLQATGGVGYVPVQWGEIAGCDGQPIREEVPGTAHLVTSPTLAFDVQPLFRAGVPAQATVTGNAGALIVLVSGETPGWRPLGTFAGTLLVGTPLRVSVLGNIPAGGVLQHTLLAPDPGTPEDTFSIHYQCVALTGGGRYLSEPRRVIVLDPSL